MATLASPFEPGEDPNNTNIVKLVADRRGFALYFSRSLVPFDRDAERLGRRPGMTDPAAADAFPGWHLPGPGPFKHPGLYAYRRPFLSTYASLPPAPLEEAEIVLNGRLFRLEEVAEIEIGGDLTELGELPELDHPDQMNQQAQTEEAADVSGVPR